MNKRHPLSWIPTLYFAEALPYVAVMVISVLMYKRMGISNTDVALYTSWLYLPWVIKPLWSPVVDILKKKRWWIVVLQLLIGAGFAGIAFTIPTSFFFQATLAFFWLIAFSSATHDIAADGFYMLALDSHNQALYVGIRSTFYRIATIFGQGLLIMFAGWVGANSGLKPVEFELHAQAASEQHPSQLTAFCLTSNDSKKMTPHINTIYPNEPSNKENPSLAAHSIPLAFVCHPFSNPFTAAQVDSLKQLNSQHHFTAPIEQQRTQQQTELNAFERWIKKHFGENRSHGFAKAQGAVSVVCVSPNRSLTDDEEITLNISMKHGDESITLIEGAHLVFNTHNTEHEAYVIFKADPHLTGSCKATFEGTSGNIPFAWSLTFFILAALFIIFSAYHKWALPRPSQDGNTQAQTLKQVIREFGQSYADFFKKDGIGAALAFMLLFRLPEAQLVKLVNPFLLDSVEAGGLSLTTGQVGFVYGTVGMVGLTLGGILGGMAVARHGLKRWLWPMVLSISLPDLVYIYLSYTLTTNHWIINACVFTEQFGYGFGFTAYMLYLIYFARGKNSTAHYAMCTAFMALGMMLPGMMAGWLEDLIGYRHFFIWVMLCCFVTVGVSALLHIDPNFGKKSQTNNV